MASDSPIATHLLKEAARIISQSGIESLKQRGFAKAAGTSPSVIAYHFEDMENFRTQAIWHALVNGIPSQFDMDIPASPPPASLAEWLKTLNGLLKPGTDEQPAGFYIGFARLTGQTCLLATRDPSLRPLVRYLRELEGWGFSGLKANSTFRRQCGQGTCGGIWPVGQGRGLVTSREQSGG
ncbi:TetR/AcrR family transcriptional regulator [Altererythrobacter sp. BO-6]|uniref:TetR/AcrR family transcriptional regulator n=1 Tax=Altererythrobacter sp. BO-6 TaxID=2604537 RepID=UPI0013E19221|nr:TetR/AcrR family transcriptional regulator [Altererythrobacter sp. BO-6]QIG54714.1 TetR/AcrR family transcriptional regulator [Altererythrobacter sp. BO-6]